MDASSQEKNVSAAFSKQAASFDEYDEKNIVLKWMRKQIQDHLIKIAKPSSDFLELNCGTGIDAVFLAQKGFHVHATDNAQGMLNELNKKIETLHLEDMIATQKLSFNELERLEGKKFDHVFSNFGGLNCAADLSSVIKKIIPLLNKDGIVTLVIMPRVCPWEIINLFKGNFKLALRRFKKNGADSHLEGEHFKTYYYSPKYVKHAFGNEFQTISQIGLASFCPPPFMENFQLRFPNTLKKLMTMDERSSTRRPFKNCADHYLISLHKIHS